MGKFTHMCWSENCLKNYKTVMLRPFKMANHSRDAFYGGRQSLVALFEERKKKRKYKVVKNAVQ